MVERAEELEAIRLQYATAERVVPRGAKAARRERRKTREAKEREWRLSRREEVIDYVERGLALEESPLGMPSCAEGACICRACDALREADVRLEAPVRRR
ncbi:MAG: hypothetical protein MKZ95_04885 [Pirellulales bacterium]|nr:hypothetical protein [Pirellulales bacterium]